MNPNPTAVFDLDGTLAETGPDLVSALNYAISTLELPPVNETMLSAFLGQGALAMIEKTLKHYKYDASKDVKQKLLDKFLSHYSENMPGQTRLYGGAYELLDALKTAKWTICICTNKSEFLAHKLLKSMNIFEEFSSICGGDSFDFKKPDGRHILETIRKANGNTARAIMFGDSLSDIAAAKDIKIPVVAVSFGYTDKPVSEFNPDKIIESYQDISLLDLHELMDQYFQNS